MLKLLFKQTWYIVFILLLIIAEPVLNSILNFELQDIFNTVTVGINTVIILRLLTIIFFLWILKRVISYVGGILRNRFIANAKEEVKHRLFIKLIGLNTGSISRIASSGEYISIFTNDIALLETRFFEQVLSLVGNIFGLLILGTSFFILNFKLAMVITLFGVLNLLVPMLFSKELNKRNLVYSNTVSTFTQKMKEYMVAYPTIKNYSIEDQISRKFNDINHKTENAKFESDSTLTLANNTGQMLAWFMQFIGVGLGLVMVAKGEILIGTVIAAQSFASDLANPLQGILTNVNSIKSVKQIVKKLERMTEGTDIEAKEVEVKEVNATPDIEFKDFSLTLDTKSIIKDFSFKFSHGKKYLVVGLNGSGKSTLFKSLKKWYEPTNGNIIVGEKDISEITSEELSHMVSYLNENVSLFSGAVKENITLFNQDTDEEKFKKVIEDAQIKLDLDREITDEGRNISSGEQRRIEIARSLLNDVSVIIFDEVVSTLDIESAYEIEKMALEYIDKTVIFISHNFSGKLIKQYDEILVMQDGKLLDHGSYNYLINNCAYFKKICDIKFGV